MGAGDGAAERGDEGLGGEGVIGGGFVVAGGLGVAAVGEGQDLGFEVEVDAGGVGSTLRGVGMGVAWAGFVVVGVEGGESEEQIGCDRGVGAGEMLLCGEGDGYG